MSEGKKRFIGIDLGTSNSAIASYRNGEIQVWKDPEQKEVMASVIYVSGRGTKSVGNRAYASAMVQSSYGARLFKRLMGSDTKVPMKGLKEEWTPEQCSAEILRTLVSYVPAELQEEIGGIVVTVPAAFDQAQKSATLQAAEDAGIGAVTLLQEPVAAVMAATQSRTTGGHLVVYDLGGGTLDVAVAEWTKRGIILHAHGGIAMCGGRDIDRAIYEEVVQPWVDETFSMPEGWQDNPQWQPNEKGEQGSICCYAAELAKIRLSHQEETKIELEEHQLNAKDLNGEDLYLDIPLDRDQLDAVMTELEEASVNAVRDTLKNGGFEAEDMDEVVFIGGPTQYERLRSRVCAGLGIEGQVESDPMTAVATGAAIFAEGVDWSTGSRGSRKKTREKTQTAEGIELELAYDKRVSGDEAKITVIPKSGCEGATAELESETTGWASGEVEIEGRISIGARLTHDGEHVFTLVLRRGTHVERKERAVTLTRAPATVGAVPLSRSIGIAVVEGRNNEREKMVWLAKEGDELPIEGEKKFVANESVEAGSPKAVVLKVYEGEDESPGRNVQHGVMKVEGADISTGSIKEGDELIVKYRIGEGGELHLRVRVPTVQVEAHEYYRHEEGRYDYRKAAGLILLEGAALHVEVDEADDLVDDKRLTKAKALLDDVEEMDEEEDDPETVKQTHDRVKEAQALLAGVEKDHKSTLLRCKVEAMRKRWNDEAAPWAEEGVQTRVQKMLDSAATSAGLRNDECEDMLADISREIFNTLWKEDWYVAGMFRYMKGEALHGRLGPGAAELVEKGDILLQRGDCERLKQVVLDMFGTRPARGGMLTMMARVNVRAA